MDQAFVLKGNHHINDIDPRIKILQSIVGGALLFVVHTQKGVLLNVFIMVCVLIFFKLYQCAIRLSIYSLTLFALLQVTHFIGGKFSSILSVSLFILFKFAPVMGVYYVMVKSISAGELVSALERLKFPRAITITLAVTLRFLPTIGEEMRAISDSMKLRNIPLNAWNLIRRPMMLEFVMVPMMMRFVKVAEELSAAAIVRGIEYPGTRSSLFEIRLRVRDFVYLLVVLSYALLLYFVERR